MHIIVILPGRIDIVYDGILSLSSYYTRIIL